MSEGQETSGTAERLATLGLVLVLLVSGAIAWWFQLRPDLAFDAAQLQRLPLRIGDWRGESIPLESAVESMLRADVNLQRAYREPHAGLVWLYIGYYGTARGGRPEHKPDVCYPSAGWRIAEERVWVGDAERDERATEYVVTQGGQERLVHFWYQSSQRTGLLGTWSVSVDQLTSRLSSGRADGALVRLSTPIDGSEDEARERLVAFRRVLDPEIASRWPDEQPALR